MNILSFLITLILAGLLTLLVIWLPVAIVKNMERGHTRRRKLAQDVDALRLGTMLERLGKNRDYYLHDQHIVDIEHHMKRCNACETIDSCDDLLKKEQPLSANEVQFCPNVDELDKTRAR